MPTDTHDRKPAKVEADVRRLLAQSLRDDDLRARLEELSKQWAFAGFTWLWGPELYRRNRVVFRPFILAHFGTTLFLKKWQWQNVAWKGPIAEALDRWLAEVDQNDDVDLFRRLYQWKTMQGGWRLDAQATIRSDLLRRFDQAATPATRAVVADKFNFWFELDEAAAVRLYEIDPVVAGAYILRHLPSRWGWSQDDKRVLWTRLFDLTLERGDRRFAMKLYRRQAPDGRWETDALALCQAVSNPADLCARLDEIHPEGWGLELGTRIMRLVEARGRDVVPYVLKHLKNIWPRWHRLNGYTKLLDRAYAERWWDLWSGLLRTSARVEDWNKVIRQLLHERALSAQEIERRLLHLTGAGREWNLGGFSLVNVQQLDDATALALYDRFPELVRGPFKLHLQTGFWTSLPQFIRRVVSADDETLVDFMASRMVNRNTFWAAGKPMEDLDPLADYFEALRDRDPALFSRRAAHVLTQIPAYTFFRYDKTLRDNRLARLLMERSLGDFLDDPVALGDLVEASEIHVQHLAYRVLGLDDERARKAAALHLDILIGTLLRLLHRTTRLAAFRALANACTTAPTARRVLDRARDALALPDTKYPKEHLIGLIGTILDRWPELRRPSEATVVYASRRA